LIFRFKLVDLVIVIVINVLALVFLLVVIRSQLYRFMHTNMQRYIYNANMELSH
jgi:hypothetical protein